MRRYFGFCALGMAMASAHTERVWAASDTFEVGTYQQNEWEGSVITSLRFDYQLPDGTEAVPPVPFYADAKCKISSPQFEFEMDDDLGLEWFSIRVPQFNNARGEIILERGFHMLIDGAPLEIGVGANHSPKLIGFPYPQAYVSSPGFVGYLAYRLPETEHWITLPRLFDRLLAANDASIGSELGSKPNDGSNSAWTALDLNGLRQAVTWCQDTLRSDAARTISSEYGSQ